MSPNLLTIQAIAVGIAHQAGEILQNYFDHPHQEETKTNQYDIVTEGDRDAEVLIAQTLHDVFPDHHIAGEEGGEMGAPADTAEYFWYIDPLDGTTNFASNIPLFSISIALADRHMKPLVGVVYNPIHNELYTAVQGHGAFLNGKRLHVSHTDSLEKAVLGTGFPYEKGDVLQNNLRAWNYFMLQTRGIRRLGSAALDLCYVAAGRFDGFWERKLNPWDCMAGNLMVLEAGGMVTDYAGVASENHLYGLGQIVASNGRLHADMLTGLSQAQQNNG